MSIDKRKGRKLMEYEYIVKENDKIIYSTCNKKLAYAYAKRVNGMVLIIRGKKENQKYLDILHKSLKK